MPDSLIQRACTFATARHAGQRRMGSATPYIVHPAGVAQQLTRYYPECSELIAAGWLHDVLEDTATSEAELYAAFGPQVASLVVAVTKRRGTRWQLDVRRHEVVRLKAADLLDNLSATADDLAQIGPAVWERFAGGEPRKRRYYSELTTEVSAVLGAEPLAGALRAALVRCFPD